jgi:hypothetical protein
MKYEEAIKIRAMNGHLVGTMSKNGFMIDEIIIVPSKTESRNKFFALFLSGKAPESVIELFQNEDMQVWAIDKKYLYESNILFFVNITNTPNKHNEEFTR